MGMILKKAAKIEVGQAYIYRWMGKMMTVTVESADYNETYTVMIEGTNRLIRGVKLDELFTEEL